MEHATKNAGFGAERRIAGLLVNSLREFSSAGNLTRIESRPRRTALGHYMFFADLEAASAASVGDALKALASASMSCVFSGRTEYRRGVRLTARHRVLRRNRSLAEAGDSNRPALALQGPAGRAARWVLRPGARAQRQLRPINVCTFVAQVRPQEPAEILEEGDWALPLKLHSRAAGCHPGSLLRVHGTRTGARSLAVLVRP